MLPGAEDRREGCRAVVRCQARFFFSAQISLFLIREAPEGVSLEHLKWRKVQFYLLLNQYN